MSSFFGINVALSALKASQYALDVTAHNIANANTEGYRRQEPIFTANPPGTGNTSASAATRLGTGVTLARIKRTQTGFLDHQIRLENQLAGMWDAKNNALQQIEPLLNEPGDSGISSELDNFWNSWVQLEAYPENLPARVEVVSRATTLSDKISNLYQNLRTLQEDFGRQIEDNANEINAIAAQIAGINNQLRETAGGDLQPNDLVDKRDLLIQQLSSILGIEVNGAEGSGMIISVGGMVLVQGGSSVEIAVGYDSNGSKLVWADDGSDLKINGGETKGLMESRDNLLEGYITSLNTLASTLVEAVNSVHSAGYDADGAPAGNFFVPGTDAGSIRVADAIANSPRLVAASLDPLSRGDNLVARQIAELQNTQLIGNNTINDAYSTLVAQIGANAREAATFKEAHDAALSQRKMELDSLAGVSLDEEMANMVRFQQSYNAAARIFTVVNDMLETIINII